MKLTISSEKSSVRADSSASRGNAMELVANLKILFLPTVKIDIDDTLELNNCQFRVLGLVPRSDVNGRPDHIEVLANIWSKL